MCIIGRRKPIAVANSRLNDMRSIRGPFHLPRILHCCQKLIAPDPAKRFHDAQAADLDRKGAADFHRQLVKGDPASEYEHDLRLWLEELS